MAAPVMAQTPFSEPNRNVNGAYLFGPFAAAGLIEVDWSLTSGDVWTNPPGTDIIIEVDVDRNDGLGMVPLWGPTTYRQGGTYTRNGVNGGLPVGILKFSPSGFPSGWQVQIAGSTSARINLGATGTLITA